MLDLSVLDPNNLMDEAKIEMNNENNLATAYTNTSFEIVIKCKSSYCLNWMANKWFKELQTWAQPLDLMDMLQPRAMLSKKWVKK